MFGFCKHLVQHYFLKRIEKYRLSGITSTIQQYNFRQQQEREAQEAEKRAKEAENLAAKEAADLAAKEAAEAEEMAKKKKEEEVRIVFPTNIIQPFDITLE